MLLSVLGVILLFLLSISYYLNDKDITSPPVVFTGAFLFATCICLINAEKWMFDMHFDTFILLLIGIASFLLFYFFVYRGNIRWENNFEIKENKKEKYILKKGFFIFLLILLYCIASNYMYISSIPGDDFGTKLYTYRAASLLGEFEDFYPRSFINENLNVACLGIMYVVIYFSIRRYITENKWSFFFVVSCILFIINVPLYSGARGLFIFYIIYAFIIFYIFWQSKNEWKGRIDIKNLFKFILIVFIILVIFVMALELIGRTREGSGMDVFDSVSVYAGAQLKLLDMFMHDGGYTIVVEKNTDDVFGSYVFWSLYKWLSVKLSEPDLLRSSIAEFRYVNGIFLGNVYTMFWQYYLEAGYWGVCFFSGCMGVFFGFLYKKIRKYRTGFNMYVVMYAFLFKALVLCFFMDYFYDAFSFYSFKMLILAYLFYVIFARVKKV